MKKLHILLTFAFIACFIQGCAKTGTVKKIDRSDNISEAAAQEEISRRIPFHVNKRFVYLIAWNGIPVGSVTAESGDVIEYRGREVYVVTIVTASNKFLSRIYRVEDTYISYIDTETMSSMRYEANREEGSYRKKIIVEYDFDKMEAIYYSLLDGSVKRCDIKENVQDPVSAMCYFMTLPLKVGDRISYVVNLNEKNYDLYGEVKDIEVVKLPEMGNFPAFRIVPSASLKGKEYRRGRGWMYFSADDSRYPLYGVVRIPFGRVTATLRSVEDID